MYMLLHNVIQGLQCESYDDLVTQTMVTSHCVTPTIYGGNLWLWELNAINLPVVWPSGGLRHIYYLFKIWWPDIPKNMFPCFHSQMTMSNRIVSINFHQKWFCVAQKSVNYKHMLHIVMTALHMGMHVQIK